LILWASDTDPGAVDALWDQDWPRDREYRFSDLTKKMDAWLEQRQLVPRMVDTWKGMYGTLSEIAYALINGTPLVGLDTWDFDYHDWEPGGIARVTTATEAVEKAVAMAEARRAGAAK